MNAFYDYYLDEVCRTWLLILVIDFILSIKEGQSWFNIKGPVGVSHKIFHLIAGIVFILGGFFVQYFFCPINSKFCTTKSILLGWGCCFSIIISSVILHLFPIFYANMKSTAFKAAEGLLILGSTVLGFETLNLMGLKFLSIIPILLGLLSSLFFIRNFKRNEKRYFIIEKACCYLNILFFIFWFIL
ncbi:MAG: hypothetical protein J6V73_02350 [Spirochaetaceae bacterium]|nr:hypothetical protein [Spirochaetaceae bacterium]